MTDNIGQAIHLFRKKLRMTQQEMAARLGVERRTYAYWETGKGRPTVQALRALIDMGMPPVPGFEGLNEQSPLLPGAILGLLIETIYDCNRDPDLRASARRELYRALRLPENF